MSTHRYTKEEVAARGREIYDREIRAKLEPEHNGKFLVIDIETGQYEMDEDDVAVMERAAAKHSPEVLYGMRIGYRTKGRIGGRVRASQA
jgi:hypothetical protein